MNPLKHLTDEKLMDLYRGGESMAFEVLYDRHKNKVFSYLNRRLSPVESVNEVFQNSFMKLHKSRENYDSKFSFSSWLFTITKSELLDFYKKKRIETTSFEEELHNSETPTAPYGIDLSEQNSLKDKEKEALNLRFYSDKDYQEISELMNISNSNARKLVSRGIAKLRKKLIGGTHE